MDGATSWNETVRKQAEDLEQEGHAQDADSVDVCGYLHVHEDAVRKVKTLLPDEQHLTQLSDLFKIFGDSTRIRILYILFEEEVCVCDIARLLGMTQSAVSHQLRILKSARLIKNRRDGKTIFYSLSDDHVRTLLSQGMEHIMEE
ncbi:MAG: helix-turn-helix transcriptional regulator [Clostridia bacterium]|nr:helix-turn-helix transcriptional regulator [Clostridia bacterium]